MKSHNRINLSNGIISGPPTILNIPLFTEDDFINITPITKKDEKQVQPKSHIQELNYMKSLQRNIVVDKKRKTVNITNIKYEKPIIPKDYLSEFCEQKRMESKRRE